METRAILWLAHAFTSIKPRPPMNPRPFLLTTLALLLSLLPLAAEDKYLIRHHWEPGKVYHFETNMEMEMNAPGAPVGGPQTSSMIMMMDADVRKEAGSDRKLVTMKFVSIKAMMSMGGEIKTYDSADPAMSEPEFQQVFGALSGKGVTLVYDKEDKFADVIIPEDFLPTPVGDIRGPDGKQFAEMIRSMVDFGLPPDTLAVGASYAAEKNIGMQPFGGLNAKLKGRLDSLVNHEGRKHAKLVSEGSMGSSPPGADAPPVPVTMPDSKISAETLFDLERKTVSRSTARQEMTMNMGAPAPTMTKKQTTVTTLKSIDTAPPEKKDKYVSPGPPSPQKSGRSPRLVRF